MISSAERSDPAFTPCELNASSQKKRPPDLEVMKEEERGRERGRDRERYRERVCVQERVGEEARTRERGRRERERGRGVRWREDTMER